jgi:DNA-binding response OmpR family regulator
MRILIVEDERKLAKSLEAQFAENGFEVSVAASCAEARMLVQQAPAIILLDWRLPDGEGIELLREWRAEGNETPVIFITARSDVIDKVLALELGGNDYLTKPFEPRELLARVKVQLKLQRRVHKPEPTRPSQSRLSAAGIILELSSRRAHFDKQPIELAKMEFELLKLFLEHPDEVLSRREIMNKVWGTGNYQTSRTIDSHVAALRKKIDPSLFETVRGIGYRFSPKPGKRAPE